MYHICGFIEESCMADLERSISIFDTKYEKHGIINGFSEIVCHAIVYTPVRKPFIIPCKSPFLHVFKTVIFTQIPAHRQNILGVAPGEGRDTERLACEGVDLLGHNAAAQGMHVDPLQQ